MKSRVIVGKNFILATLTGLLLILAFPPFFFHPLALLALVPLLWVISRTSFKGAFFYGLASGAIFFGGLLYWLLEITPWAGVPLTILAWLLLSLVEALSFGLFGVGASLIQKNYRLGGRLFLIPTLWTALELLRSLGPWGFSWGLLGLTQTSNLLILQGAKVFGGFGLSYILVFFNTSLTEFFLLKSKEAPKILPVAGGVITLLLFLLGGGFYFLKNPPQENLAKENFFKIALVQGNIAQEEKFAEDTQEKVESRYLRLTQKAAKKTPYLIIWPETALPRFFEEEKAYLKKVLALNRSKSYLLLGSLREEQEKLYNSAFLFSPQGKAIGSYDKIKLVLFGEYVPPFPPFSNIKALAGLGESITAGDKFTLFKTTKGNLATVICFESANPFLTRKMTIQGAEMLVTITNDAWFGKTAAAREHLEMLRMRAVENGIFGLQVANTGISAIIDPQGRILKESSWFREEVILGKAAFLKGKTFYTRFGFSFPWFALILTLISFASTILRKVKKAKKF